MDLLKRLRKVEPDGEGERTRWYRNPDGPEAADEIERLRGALKDIGAECFVTHGTDKEMWEGWRAIAVERVDIARAALKGDE